MTAWLRYGLPFALGIAITLLWHGYVVRGIENRALSAQVTQSQQAALDVWVAQQNAAQAEREATEELSRAQAETDDLARRLAAGTARLRIKVASCVPDANGSGVGTGGTAELSAVSREDYLYLRRLLEKKEAQIRVLQGSLRYSK